MTAIMIEWEKKQFQVGSLLNLNWNYLLTHYRKISNQTIRAKHKDLVSGFIYKFDVYDDVLLWLVETTMEHIIRHRQTANS